MDPCFKITDTRIAARPLDRILGDLQTFVHEERESSDGIVLDLRRTAFIDPYGMVLLCLIGRYLRESFDRVVYRLPESSQVRSYLSRMRFLKTLAKSVSLQGWSPYEGQEVRGKTESEALLEITKIEERDDIESVLEYINVRVSTILAEELGYTVREITKFKYVIAELGHNILDHSLNWGYVVAQRYTDPRENLKFVVIGVGDLGVGIKRSLSSRFDVSGWTHGRSILNALKKNFSRDPARGLGLYVVNQICNDYNGSLHIRSGDTRVYLRGRNIYEHVSTFFPGTQVGIALYERTSSET